MLNNCSWLLVTDSNYWNEEEGYTTLVSDGEKIYTQQTCPFSWGTMARAQSYWFTNIKLPEVNTEDLIGKS